MAKKKATEVEVNKEDIPEESSDDLLEKDIDVDDFEDINNDLDSIVLEDVEEKETKGTKKKEAAKLTKTRTDVMNQVREKELERIERALEREESALKWRLVQDAFHTKKLVKGFVMAVETKANDMVVAIINYNDYKTTIPFNEMFIDPPIYDADLPVEQKIRRERQILSKLLGAEVSFIIKHADVLQDKEYNVKEYIVFGSRKDALLRQKRYYYGLKNGVRRVNVDKKIKNVPIVSVGKEALMVNVLGIDVTMSKGQLSYKYIGALNKEYFVGDKIDVIVEDLKVNDDGEIQLSVNHRKTLIDTFIKNTKNCNIGGMYRGTITYIRESNVYLYLDDIEIPAYSRIIKLNNIDTLPSAGDTVLFVVNEIKDDIGLAYGTVMRLINRKVV